VSPSSVSWSPDSKTVYFNWNPEKAIADSLYSVTLQNPTPVLVPAKSQMTLPARNGVFNKAYTLYTYEKNGDVFLYTVATGKIVQITNTVSREMLPYFSGDEKKIVFNTSTNIYTWTIATGEFSQLTDFQSGKKNIPTYTDQDKWLRQDQ